MWDTISHAVVMTHYYSLNNLSLELVIKICRYLDIRDLCNLRQTCWRLYEIINEWDHVFLKPITTVVTNQIHSLMLQRSFDKLSSLEKLRISRNWLKGRYVEKQILQEYDKYRPWLQLSKDNIWVSRGNKILNLERNSQTIIAEEPSYHLQGSSSSDVTRFVYRNNLLAAGQGDGSIWLWSKEENQFLLDIPHCHYSDINCVEIYDRILMSGSRDNYFKAWKIKSDNLEQIGQVDLNDRIWCMTALEEKPLVAVGTAANVCSYPVFILDIERLEGYYPLNCDLPPSGVLDIKWASPNTLWSCGYDGIVKFWDIRSKICESKIEDPFSESLYSLDCDYFNTVVCGSNMHGRVVLWDTRMTEPLQIYYMESCRHRRSSPVYSLAFDPKYLFAATDRTLINILDFSTCDGVSRDFAYFIQ